MENNLGSLEKCPCCGGQLHEKSLDKLVEGGYERICSVCVSTITNVNISDDGVFSIIEPCLNKGRGALYIGRKDGFNLGFIDKDYSNIEQLIKMAEEYIEESDSTIDDCYIYKFDPNTNTGEFIWGNYNPFENK